MAADLMPTPGLERVKAGVISLLDPPFGTDLEETLDQEGTPAWQLRKRREFDSSTFMQPSRVLDRVESHVGAALSLHLQGLAQHAPSPDKRGGLR
jgi:hypothetical protein